MSERQVKWAILFTPFEHEDTEYVKEGCGAMWTQDSPVKVFDTYGEAQKECAKWNTGIIVDFNTNKSVGKVSSYNDIRPFSLDERNRATERRLKNNGQ